jgi:hypothetical protein
MHAMCSRMPQLFTLALLGRGKGEGATDNDVIGFPASRAQ